MAESTLILSKSVRIAAPLFFFVCVPLSIGYVVDTCLYILSQRPDYLVVQPQIIA
ncbi:MAG TPA: hypothetical protein VFU05_06765 [Cyclobacteriaceae bacterium]|nr:hypothetical protein [Cyclobacteriaceae bacterium]